MTEDLKKLSKEEVIKQIVDGVIIDFNDFNEDVKKDRDVIKALISKDGTEAFKEDEDDGLGWGVLNPNLKEDKELLLLAYKTDATKITSSSLGMFPPEKEYVPKKFQKDEEVILAAVKGGWDLNNVDKNFKNYRDIVQAAIKLNPTLYEKIDSNLKKDKEILLEAIKAEEKDSFNPSSQFQFADESLKKDKDLILSAVKHHGYILKYLDDNFKKDKEIVLEAVKQNGLVFKEIDKDLKNDREVIIVAVKGNSWIFQNLTNEFKNDEEICLASLTKDTMSFFHIDKTLKGNKNFILKAINVNPHVLSQADESFQKDPEIFELVKTGKAFKDLYSDDIFKVLKHQMPDFEFLCFFWDGGGDSFGGYKLKHSKAINKNIDEVKISEEKINKIQKIMDYCMIIQELELKVNWVDVFTCRGGLVMALKPLTNAFNWKISELCFDTSKKFNEVDENYSIFGEIDLPIGYTGISISGEGVEEIFSEIEQTEDEEFDREPEYDINKFTRKVEIKENV